MASQVISAVAHLLSFVHWLYTAGEAATAGCTCPEARTENPAQQLPGALHYTNQWPALVQNVVSLSLNPLHQVQTVLGAK